MTITLTRRLRWTACLLATLACSAALHAAAGADDASAGRVVDHVFADPSAPIVVHAGQLFLIAQEANPSTGYHWVASPSPDPAVAVLRGTSFMATSGLVGAPGREIRVYEATGPGSTSIVLAYVPPGNGAKPAKHVTFAVTVTPADAR
jgi:predicted secreted protein